MMKALLLTEKRSSSKGLDAVVSALESHGYQVYHKRTPSGGPWDLAVCWGSRSDPSRESHLVVNPAEAVQRSLSLSDGALLLNWHGIPVSWDHLPQEVARPVNRPPDHEYVSLRVHVGDLRVLAVEEDPDAPFRPQPLALALSKDHGSSLPKRLRPRAAFRVRPSQSASQRGMARRTGRPLSPTSGTRSATPTAQASSTWQKSAARASPLTVKSPWAQIRNSPSPPTTAGPFTPPATSSIGGRSDMIARVGRGGEPSSPLPRSGPIPAPRPSSSPITSNALSSRQGKPLPTSGTRWMAGSNPLSRFPTGGHVHLSGIPLTTPILLALDTYVAIPFMLLERRTRARQRRRKYGRLGEFRRKEHGGFEYRTLPSWLVSPAATRAALCLVKVVATEWPRLQAEPMRLPSVVKEFYLGKKPRFRQGFHRVWRRILSTPTGKTYAHELGYVKRMVMSENEWNDDDDIKPAWWQEM